MLSASRTARARSFYTHERTRTTKSTVDKHSYHMSIGGGCRRSWRRASRARPAFVTVDMLTRHILVITLCGALASVSIAFKKARKAEHVSFVSRARQVDEVPMVLCVCSCVTIPSQDDLPQCLRLLPRAARDGPALCHLSRQDTSRGVPSQDRHRSKLCAYRR